MIITHETTPLQSEAANQLDTRPIVVVIIYGTLYISLSEMDPLNVSSFIARVRSV